MKTLKDIIQEKLVLNKNLKSSYDQGFPTKEYRKNWSLQTAKDGDIISNKYSLMYIYKGLKKNCKINNDASPNAIVYHAYYLRNNNELKVGTDTGVGTVENNNNYNGYELASDEEYEIFYEKLKENGYKWDNYKKEIVKI